MWEWNGFSSKPIFLSKSFFFISSTRLEIFSTFPARLTARRRAFSSLGKRVRILVSRFIGLYLILSKTLVISLALSVSPIKIRVR